MTSEEISPSPFEQAAHAYFAKQWPVVPLPSGQKFPPATGYTGYDCFQASGADIQDWIDNGYRAGKAVLAAGNIALHMPETVIGIDVDAYGDKQGAATFAAAEKRMGQLPPTYSSTSRGIGISSIRFYRVQRHGRKWKSTLGPDVEIIHHGHRYAVVAPSIHPSTGQPYVWYSPTGSQCSAPSPDDLPYLPTIWEEWLNDGDAADRPSKALLDPAVALVALDSFPSGPACKVQRRYVERARTELSSATSRHDTVRPIIAAIVRAGEMGHRGSKEALLEVHDIWAAALRFGERRDPGPGEFERMVVGWVAAVTQDPTAEADKGCCGSVMAGGVIFDPVTYDSFWSAREELAVIQQWARARLTSPWAVLGCVLTRCVVSVLPHVVLPPLIGGEASLNLFVALVGPSGMGKGAAEAVAAEAVTFPEIEAATIGSGEGIAHLYGHRERDGSIARDRKSVLFTVPEVDQLVALGNRQGATLLPQLRIAWSGEKLGFGYADPKKAIPIDRHTYRMGLVLGLQPGRAEPLLSDSDGGTPQRFLWLPTTDPGAPDVAPEVPEVWPWESPWRTMLPPVVGMHWIKVCEVARDTVIENRRAQVRTGTAPLDGHALLCRLKTAAAFGLLNQRPEISEEDWELAGVLMRVSDATRNGVAEYITSQRKQGNQARAEAEGDRAVIVSSRVQEAVIARIAKTILRGLERKYAGEAATLRDVKHLVASKDREHVEEALDALVKTDQVAVSETDEGVRFAVRNK